MNNNRSKNKVLVFIILLLLITNFAVLGYFLFFRTGKAPEKNKFRDFTAVLQKEVGFNDQQVAQFNELKKGHWQQALDKMQEIIQIKNTIFELSKQDNTPDSIIERLADSIGTLQREVEINVYKHVVATRKICTADQVPAYDSLIKRIINRGRMGRLSEAPHREPEK